MNIKCFFGCHKFENIFKKEVTIKRTWPSGFVEKDLPGFQMIDKCTRCGIASAYLLTEQGRTDMSLEYAELKWLKGK